MAQWIALAVHGRAQQGHWWCQEGCPTCACAPKTTQSQFLTRYGDFKQTRVFSSLEVIIFKSK
mgnify:FL=1